MEGRLIRHVELEGTGYTLKLYDNDTWRGDRLRLGYEFADPDGTILFTGRSFSPSPCADPESDESVRCLLGFLTLQEGDTDAEYFADYTDAQLAFCRSDICEMLQEWAIEDGAYGEDYEAPKFVDLAIDSEDVEG